MIADPMYVASEWKEPQGEIKVRGDNKILMPAVMKILEDEHPMTLRSAYYRCLSVGALDPDDDKTTRNYDRLQRLVVRLRDAGVLPWSWIVDNVRITRKPNSWSGLEDFGDAVRHLYRKNLWAKMPEAVQIFTEKDAIAATVFDATYDYDVPLHVIRGYSSITYAHGLAESWGEINKPIHCYYLGDFDPSGFDLERAMREAIARHCPRGFYWQRIGVVESDFEELDLRVLRVKKSDSRHKAFMRKYGDRAAEVDAIPAPELRRRVEESILNHIDADEWERLRRIEEMEQESIDEAADALAGQALLIEGVA